MSAEILREAARVMRERAEAAPKETRTSGKTTGVWLHNAYHLTTTPAVALAVADWLDSLADAMTNPDAPGGSVSTDREERRALAVARAYIGSAS